MLIGVVVSEILAVFISIRDLIFDTQLWAQGTIIRDWQFKGKQNGKHA